MPRLRRDLDDRIHQTARNDRTVRSGRSYHQPVHLYDNLTAVSLDRLTDRQRITRRKHIIKRNISFVVRSRSLDDGNIDPRKFIVQKLFSVQLHILDQRIIPGNRVDPRSLLTRIHEDIQPDLGESSRQPAGLRTYRMGNTSKRKIIRLETILQHQLFGTVHRPEVSAYDLIHRAFPDIPFRSSVLIPGSESCTGYHRKMPGRAGCPVSFIQRLMQFHRIINPQKRVQGDHIVIADQLHCLIGRHDFVHSVHSILSD